MEALTLLRSKEGLTHPCALICSHCNDELHYDSNDIVHGSRQAKFVATSLLMAQYMGQFALQRGLTLASVHLSECYVCLSTQVL